MNIAVSDLFKLRPQGQVILIAALAAISANAQTIHACTILTSQNAPTDTARIQAALNLCNPGQAVILRGASFQSGPLILPRGVTIFLDRGVTLFASKNPRDYDLSPSSCGAAPTSKAPACKPFIYSYQAAYSSIAGTGVIDGQGESWKLGAPSAPDLVQSYESTGFKLAGVTLRNAAGIHAAIYKTISFQLSDLNIDSPISSAAGPALLLSNAVDPIVSGAQIQVPSKAIVLAASILGPTTGAKLSDIQIVGGRGIYIGDDVYGPVRGVAFDRVSISDAGASFIVNTKGGPVSDIRHTDICLHNVKNSFSSNSGESKPDISSTCTNPPHAAQTKFTLDLTTLARPGTQRALTVSPGESIQKALDALPVTGGDITLKPGTYREVVTIRKPHVHLHAEDPDPAKTTIVFNNGASNSGGTFNSSTIFVEADDVTIDHLSIVNDLGSGKGQAVALHVTGDRATFRNLRISGAQDTLFSASRYCYGDYGPCVTTHHYFADCFIEGNTDFIFGDSNAFFEHCELHGVPTGQVMYTAQSKHTPDQDSAYVFDHCHLTGAPRQGVISLGRAWRPYATVGFLHAQIDAPVTPEGWTEWLRLGVPTLPTAYFAEYDATGPGANPQAREKYAHQLTATEAAPWSKLDSAPPP